MIGSVADPRRVEIEAGVELHYSEAGSGVPLVLIHGLTGDLGSWGAQLPVFAQLYRTIAYSRRFSRPNQNDRAASPEHSVWVEAEDLAALLKHLDAAPAILVGSSYGAYTALALAMRQPALVRALVLCEPPVMAWADLVDGGRSQREAFERDVVEAARQAYARGDDGEAAQIYARGVMGQFAVDGLPESVRARRFSNGDAIKALALSRREFLPLDLEQTRAIKHPTLLISGADTRPLFASIYRGARSLMPHADAVCVPGAGHSVYREQPDVFNSLALEFCARLSR